MELADTSPEDVIAAVSIPLAVRDHALQSLRTEQDDLEASRRLRAQQAEAYQASLAQDLERERQAQEKAEQEQREQDDLERERKEQEELERQADQWRIWARHALVKPEPVGGPSEGIVKISLRLENGKRVIRKFDGSEPIESIYQFV